MQPKEKELPNPRTRSSPPPPFNMGKKTSCNGDKRPPPAPPQYRGVRRRTWGSWVSEIRAPHQKTRIWLGSYSTPEAAAHAYDAALLCLKGSSASFNFPAALPHHVSATAMSPKSIQRVAAAAAAAAADHSPSPPPPRPSSPEDTEEDRQSTMTRELEKADDGTYGAAVMDVGGFQYDPKCLDDHTVAMNAVLVSSSSCSSSRCSWEEECDEMGDFNLWSF